MNFLTSTHPCVLPSLVRSWLTLLQKRKSCWTNFTLLVCFFVWLASFLCGEPHQPIDCERNMCVFNSGNKLSQALVLASSILLSGFRGLRGLKFHQWHRAGAQPALGEINLIYLSLQVSWGKVHDCMIEKQIQQRQQSVASSAERIWVKGFFCFVNLPWRLTYLLRSVTSYLAAGILNF